MTQLHGSRAGASWPVLLPATSNSWLYGFWHCGHPLANDGRMSTLKTGNARANLKRFTSVAREIALTKPFSVLVFSFMAGTEEARRFRISAGMLVCSAGIRITMRS